MLNKYLNYKSCLISGMLLLTAGMPAQACFPGYQDYLASREHGIQANSSLLTKHNGKSYEQIEAYNKIHYDFDLQLASLPVEGYQLVKMGRGLNDSSSNRLGLYPLKDNKAQGFVLLEVAGQFDICDQEAEIQQELQGKQRVYNYLPQLPVPAGLELQFYEQVKGKFVERLALLVDPNKDFTQPPHFRGRYITLRARYRIELEPFIKPEIQRYFEHNLSDWAMHAEP